MLSRMFVALVLALGLLTVAPVSEADASSWSWLSSWKERRAKHQDHYKKHRWRKSNGTSSGKNAVPELDPTAAGSAIVLVLGGVAYIASRRREDEGLV